MPDGAACYVWEFTLPKRELSPRDVWALMRNHCKAFTYQLERGDKEGYVHYQGRLSLRTKIRETSAPTVFPGTGIHISPTSNNARKGPPFYCLKDDTRLEGPWTEKSFTEPKRKLKCITKMEEEGLLPWQTSILERIKGYDPRHIHVLVDTKGNNGKTWLMKWVQFHELGQIIPPMYSAEDLIGFTMSYPDMDLYVIDMPRAMKKTKLAGFYSGVETIKNGILYDKRYKGKFHMMDEPQVLVCTNMLPNPKYLSKDRWMFYDISKDKKLIPLDLANYARVQEEADHVQDEVVQETAVDEEILQSELSGQDSEASEASDQEA